MLNPDYLCKLKFRQRKHLRHLSFGIGQARRNSYLYCRSPARHKRLLISTCQPMKHWQEILRYLTSMLHLPTRSHPSDCQDENVKKHHDDKLHLQSRYRYKNNLNDLKSPWSNKYLLHLRLSYYQWHYPHNNFQDCRGFVQLHKRTP